MQQRLALIQHIAAIKDITNDTLLSDDVDIKRRLLSSLKRQLNGLERRFERMHCGVDVKMCAQYFLGKEMHIADPLQCCRYYDGADTPNALLAEYEMRWMQKRNDENQHEYMLDMMSEYMYHGLMMFADYDKAPMSLKALLFNRFCHWSSGGVDEFKEWYYNTYKAEALR